MAAASDAVVHGIFLRETRLREAPDAAAPAHAHVTMLAVDRDQRVVTEQWLLAESCWADAFFPPSFRELALWGFGVLPWIVGSHFAAQVQRRLAERPGRRHVPDGENTRRSTSHRIWAFSAWMWRLAAAIGGLGFGLLSSIVTIPILAVMLALGAIPIPKLRSALLRLQLRMAATIGDCYVLLARPIEAASIVSGVRRDLAWLSARCSEVAIVAHSQGGAIAHVALRSEIPEELKLLFTFGSGLRKLEEARELMRSGSSFARASMLTAAALAIFILSSAVLVVALVDRLSASKASIVAVLAWTALAAAVCVAGVRDHLRGIRLPGLDRWITRLRSLPLRWIDCYASGDPVPNGVVSPAAAAQSREVCNRSSMLRDHTTYWSNRDEFVSLLYDEIARSRAHDPFPALRLDGEKLARNAARRRWRVAIGRVIEWAGVIAILLVVARRWPAWQHLASWGLTRVTTLIANVFGLPARDLPPIPVDWPALGFLALIAVPYGMVRAQWSWWNQAEMQRALGLTPGGWTSKVAVLTSVWFLVVAVAGLLIGDYPGFLVFMLCFVPSMLFIILEPRESRASRDDSVSRVASRTIDGARTANAENVVAFVIALGMSAALPFGVGLATWDVFVWLTSRLAAGQILGFRPDSIPSMAIGALAVVVLFLGVSIRVGWTAWRGQTG